MSFPEALMRRRRAMDETLPSGETVYEFLRRQRQYPTGDPRAPRPNPALSTPDLGQNPATGTLDENTRSQMTRPRTATMPPPVDQADSTATRQRAVSFDPATGRPNETFYEDDPRGLLGAYQKWQPRGAKRGLKNSLKAGAMMAAEAVRNNPNDPVTAALAGFGVGAAGGTAVPNFKNRLLRQWKLGQLGGEVKSNLELQKAQAAIDQSQMVEVELDNGQRVMVPAKSAATLQSRQQEIGLRDNTLEARKKRWGQLGEHEAARDAQALYNSGAADDSAELRAEIARRLRLPAGTALPPRGLGNQIKLDDAGNYIIISPRSGAVTPTTTPAGTPATSYEPTKEAARERRFNTQQANISARQTQRLAAQGQRGGVKVDATTRRQIAQGVGAIERVKRELTAIDEQIKAAQGDNARLTRLGRQRQEKVNEGAAITTTLNELDPNNESGSGTGGYPYRKPRDGQTAAPSGRTIEGAVEAFRRKVGRAPTAEEVARMKTALGQ